MKTKTMLIVLEASLLFVLFIVAFRDPFLHQRHHDWVIARYNAIRHPADTREVKRIEEFGLLFGNGNHCDSVVGEVRATKLSYSEIVKRYPSRPFVCPVQNETVELQVLDLTRALNRSSDDPLVELCRERGVRPAVGEVTYFVGYTDIGHDCGTDVRCN